MLAWEIPWTEEPDGLQSIGSQRVGHDLETHQQQQIYRCIPIRTATTEKLTMLSIDKDVEELKI